MDTPRTSTGAVPHMLLFRNTGPEHYAGLTEEQRRAVIDAWNAWFEGLLKEGKAVEGQPLEDATRVISHAGGKRVTDGPFAEAKEVIGGYVVLMVRDFDEATAIAQRHPGLEYGLIIEVRKLASGCHLGVVTRGR